MQVVQRTRERFALPALNARTGPRWARAIRSRRTERGRHALLSMPLFDAQRAAEISSGTSLAFIVPLSGPGQRRGHRHGGAEQSTPSLPFALLMHELRPVASGVPESRRCVWLLKSPSRGRHLFRLPRLREPYGAPRRCGARARALGPVKSRLSRHKRVPPVARKTSDRLSHLFHDRLFTVPRPSAGEAPRRDGYASRPRCGGLATRRRKS